MHAISTFSNKITVRKKTRCDHDVTMAHGCNNKVPAKLTGWSNRRGYAPSYVKISYSSYYSIKK